MRTRLCLASLLLAAAGFAVSAPSARADDKDTVTEMARRRFQEGVKFFDQKRYEEARAAFLQAYALKHHPAVLLNLAQSENRSGHPLEAARHFSSYLRESVGSPASERNDAEKGLAAARTKLGRIHLTVTSGAEVLVDGEPVGTAPFAEAVDAAPGTHLLEAKLGGKSTSASVSVQVGKSSNATLTLESGGAAILAPVPAPTPAAPPAASPPMPPPSESAEKPPVEPSKEGMPAGEPAMQVSTEGREPFFVWLGHNGVGIAGIAATVIGAGVGATFALAANKASNNVDSVDTQIRGEAARIKIMDTNGLCSDPAAKVKSMGSTFEMATPSEQSAETQRFQQACSLLSDNTDKRKQDRIYATAGFVLAGVGLTATVAAYFLTSHGSAPSTQALVVPVIGPGQTGLAVMGSF